MNRMFMFIFFCDHEYSNDKDVSVKKTVPWQLLDDFF